MRRVLLCMLEGVEGRFCCWRCRSDAVCATLLAGGAGGDAVCYYASGGAEGDALCATLLAGDVGSAGDAGGDAACDTLIAGGIGGAGRAGGDALYATLLAGGVGRPGGDALCATMLLEVPKAMRCVLLCSLEVFELLDVV